MSFLNPFLLFGSLALAIPILIHLVRREKSEIIPFSSLMFLLKVPKRSIRQQKIKNAYRKQIGHLAPEELSRIARSVENKETVA